MAAWQETEASTPLWLRLDDDDPTLRDYLALNLPPTWCVVVGAGGSLSEIYNRCYKLDIKRPWWGFIADDVVPETPGWDVRLVGVAGASRMAVPAGGHDPEGTPHFVLGGDLVRSAGWLALPGLDRLYIDTVWADVARDLGALRRVPSVVLAHRHFSNGMARFDETYQKARREEDRKIYCQWLDRRAAVGT